MSPDRPEDPRPPLVDSRGPVHRAARHLAGQHDPQCCPTDDRARARRDRRPAPVDRRLVHARLRRPPAHDGRARRPLRPPRRARRRAVHLRQRLARVRVRRLCVHAHRDPGADGRRRRADHAHHALDPHERLPRERAPQGDRDLGRRCRYRRGRRPRRRRVPHRPVRLDRRLPRERSDRHRRARGDPEARARLARPGAGTPRPARRTALDGGPRHPHRGDHPGARLGLDRRPHPGRLRHRRDRARRIRRLGAPHRYADARRPAVPHPSLHRRERSCRTGVLRTVRSDLLPDAVPPGGPRLHPARGRREDAPDRGRPHRRRAAVGEARRALRHPHRGGRRSHRGRRARCSCSPAPRRTAATRSSPRRSCCSGWAWAPRWRRPPSRS